MNEDVPSFGLARCGRIRRKSQRASDKPSGIEDMTAFVGHPVAIVFVREDDLQKSPFSTKSVSQKEIKNLGGGGEV